MRKRIIVGIILLVIVAGAIVGVALRQKYINDQNEKELQEYRAARAAAAEQVSKEEEELRKLRESADPSQIFSFSRKENNVVLITLDRAVAFYFPYIMEELPEVKKQFDGFTYYPNTVSLGNVTIYGTPAIFGGYEYTPEAMNNRKTELLVNKHNEALKVLPTVFSNNGYSVTVCDAPLAGYQWDSDVTIFDDLKSKGVKACTFLTATSEFNHELSNEQKFEQNYDFLENLPNITNNYADKGAYITFDNEITHRNLILQMPNYEYTGGVVNNANYSNKRYLTEDDFITLSTNIQVTHYHVNAAAMRLLGQWFDYLRELNVYDNTRIIIVADHGYRLGQKANYYYLGEDLLYYNPLLLVKDYNSEGEVKTDNTFMTTADVPNLATKDIIKDATNPYTGKTFASTVDKSEVHVFISHSWDVANHIRNCTYGSYEFFCVKDNIFDLSNWSKKTIYPN